MPGVFLYLGRTDLDETKTALCTRLLAQLTDKLPAYHA